MKHDISRMLRGAELAAEVTPVQFFESKDLAIYLSTTAEAMTRRWTAPPRIFLADEGADGDVAYTDNTLVHVNFSNRLVSMMGGLLGKFKCLLGIYFHELAHIIYLDFSGEKKYMDAIMEGHLPCEDQLTGPDGDELKTHAKDPRWQIFFTKLYHELSNFASDNHDENRLIAEYSMYGSETRSSLVEQCIMRARACLHANSIPVEKMLEQNEGKVTSELMMDLIFQYVRFGHVIVLSDETLDCDAVTLLQEYQADADIAANTDSTLEKYQAISRIVLRLWPLIRQQTQEGKEEQNQSDPSAGPQGSDSQPGSQGQSGSQSGSQGQSSSQSGSQGQSGSQSGLQSGNQPQAGAGNGSASLNNISLDQLLDSIANAAKQVGQTAAPQNRSSSKAARENQGQPQSRDPQGGDTQKGQSGSQPGTDVQPENHSGQSESQVGTDASQNSQGNQPQGLDGADQGHSKIKGQKPKDNDELNGSSDDTRRQDSHASDALDHLLNSIKKQMAECDVAQRVKNDALIQVKAINAAGPHKNVPLVLTYETLPATPFEIAKYYEIHAQVGQTAQRIQKKIKDELKDLELGGRSRRLAFGPTFDVTDAYRPDGRFFTKKKLPDNIPEMAVAVLVDQSGSMQGAREESARLAAILVDDFCRGLEIPVLVSGHGACYGKCHYNIFADFDRASENVKYKLSKVMHQNMNNRDGMAIEITAGLLAARPEPVKLLFIISDGQPNDINYGGDEAAEDIRSIVAKYKKKGVITFAAAIGDDKQKIKNIYKDGFLDITDLSALPKILVSTMKKQIIDLLY